MHCFSVQLKKFGFEKICMKAVFLVGGGVPIFLKYHNSIFFLKKIFKIY